MGVSILVVDDEEDFEVLIRQKFRRAIRQGEFEFRFARNGVEALQVLKEFAGFDLVLTDINMPVMDGLTLLKHLSEINPWLRAIVISAYGDMVNIRTAMNRGAFDFVTKPIDFADLHLTIEKTLRQVEERKRADIQRRKLSAIERELAVAGQLQQDILPDPAPHFADWPSLHLQAVLQPARIVGGDFYDYFVLDSEHIGFVVGDVSGKGIAAAFFMAVARTMLRSVAMTIESPQECLSRANAILSQGNDSAMFVTVFYGRLNVNTGKLDYCNGGHPAPLLINKDGEIRSCSTGGNTALGLLSDASYAGGEIELGRTDVFFAFTDGITEAFNSDGEMFGADRLMKELSLGQQEHNHSIIERLVHTVRDFQGGSGQPDDIALLEVRLTDRPPA